MLNSDLQKTQVEAAKKEAELKSAREQIGLLTKEKGVAMRDNAASYEQSLQRETQVSVDHTHSIGTLTPLYTPTHPHSYESSRLRSRSWSNRETLLTRRERE